MGPGRNLFLNVCGDDEASDAGVVAECLKKSNTNNAGEECSSVGDSGLSNKKKHNKHKNKSSSKSKLEVDLGSEGRENEMSKLRRKYHDQKDEQVKSNTTDFNFTDTNGMNNNNNNNNNSSSSSSNTNINNSNIHYHDNNNKELWKAVRSLHQLQVKYDALKATVTCLSDENLILLEQLSEYERKEAATKQQLALVKKDATSVLRKAADYNHEEQVEHENKCIDTEIKVTPSIEIEVAKEELEHTRRLYQVEQQSWMEMKVKLEAEVETLKGQLKQAKATCSIYKHRCADMEQQQQPHQPQDDDASTVSKPKRWRRRSSIGEDLEDSQRISPRCIPRSGRRSSTGTTDDMTIRSNHSTSMPKQQQQHRTWFLRGPKSVNSTNTIVDSPSEEFTKIETGTRNTNRASSVGHMPCSDGLAARYQANKQFEVAQRSATYVAAQDNTNKEFVATQSSTNQQSSAENGLCDNDHLNSSHKLQLKETQLIHHASEEMITRLMNRALHCNDKTVGEGLPKESLYDLEKQQVKQKYENEDQDCYDGASTRSLVLDHVWNDPKRSSSTASSLTFASFSKPRGSLASATSAYTPDDTPVRWRRRASSKKYGDSIATCSTKSLTTYSSSVTSHRSSNASTALDVYRLDDINSDDSNDMDDVDEKVNHYDYDDNHQDDDHSEVPEESPRQRRVFGRLRQPPLCTNHSEPAVPSRGLFGRQARTQPNLKPAKSISRSHEAEQAVEILSKAAKDPSLTLASSLHLTPRQFTKLITEYCQDDDQDDPDDNVFIEERQIHLAASNQHWAQRKLSGKIASPKNSINQPHGLLSSDDEDGEGSNKILSSRVSLLYVKQDEELLPNEEEHDEMCSV